MLKRIAYIFIQCTWGAVQSLLGLIAMLLLGNQKRGFYRCAVLTEYDIDSVPKYMRWLGCMSLGMFIFVGTHKDTSRERAGDSIARIRAYAPIAAVGAAVSYRGRRAKLHLVQALQQAPRGIRRARHKLLFPLSRKAGHGAGIKSREAGNINVA